METNEFRIDKNKVLTKEYKLDQTNPGNTIQYVRNSTGTLMVDSNNTNIESQRLVINLVNTRYKLLSFNNVLKTQFEEFLDPEIVIPETQQTDVAATSTGNLIDLQNQLNNKDEIISNLQQTVDDLSNTLNTAIPPAAPEEPAEKDTKKARIFSDGTLVRDKDRTMFYYIIEDGKKRWFQWNEDLLDATAKALGKWKEIDKSINIRGGVPILIDTTQDILDDIPEGAPFTNFDLVKNIQSPPPPPINLEDGKRLVAKWFNVENPLIIETTNTTPTESELTKQVQLYIASAEGIVNQITVWEDGPWYDWKPQLPIYDPTPKKWERSKNTGMSQGIDTFKIMFKHTSDATKDAFSPVSSNYINQQLLDAYSKIKLSIDNPEYNMILAASVFNDVNDEYYQTPEERLKVIIRYVPKMPNVLDLSKDSAISAITATGISINNITVAPLIPTTTAANIGKVQSCNPPAGTAITKDTQITLTTYKSGDISLSGVSISGGMFTNVVSKLKSLGFTNITVSAISRTGYSSVNELVFAIVSDVGASLSAYSTYTYDRAIYLKVDIQQDSYNFTYNKQNKFLSAEQIISYLNAKIPSI